MSALLESILQQTDVFMSLSLSGLGAILFTWSRKYGVIDNSDILGFKKPAYLVVPFVLFLISIFCYYILLATITGFYWELVIGHSLTKVTISDPNLHFKTEYKNLIFNITSVQLLTSLIGMIGLAAWYLWNVLRKK